MKSAISGNATKQGRMTITSSPRREYASAIRSPHTLLSP
jgi:hypothetical protein